MKLSDFQKTFKHHINKGLSYFGTAKLRQRTNFDFDVFLPTKGLNLQRDLWITIVNSVDINHLNILSN